MGFVRISVAITLFFGIPNAAPGLVKICPPPGKPTGSAQARPGASFKVARALSGSPNLCN